MTLVKKKKETIRLWKEENNKKMEDLHQSKRHLKIGIRI